LNKVHFVIVDFRFEQNANMRLLGNQTLVDSKPVEFIQVGCFEK